MGSTAYLFLGMARVAAVSPNLCFQVYQKYWVQGFNPPPFSAMILGHSKYINTPSIVIEDNTEVLVVNVLGCSKGN